MPLLTHGDALLQTPQTVQIAQVLRVLLRCQHRGQRSVMVGNQLRQIHGGVGVCAEQPEQSVSLDDQGLQFTPLFVGWRRAVTGRRRTLVGQRAVYHNKTAHAWLQLQLQGYVEVLTLGYPSSEHQVIGRRTPDGYQPV